MKYFVLLWVLCAVACKKSSTEVNQDPPELEIKGTDLSFLPLVRQSGITLYNSYNQAEDMLTTLKNAGVNTIRLRLWKNPTDPVSSFASVKNIAQECHSKGMKVLLSVHYSDTWADPGNQTKPAQWQSSTLNQLKDSIRVYTQLVVDEIQPEYIQIGNEINNGILWPDGSYNNFANFKSLLQAAIAGARNAVPETKIILHYAGFTDASAFFSSFTDLDYDIIGLSYYPIWHGKDLNALASALESLNSTYNRKIFIAETAYPFTLGFNDFTNNIIGLQSQLLPAYAPTPDGQKQFLLKLKDICTNASGCLGFCYWGTEWVSFAGSTSTNGSPWENQAFWDFSNKALPVLDVY